MLGARARGRILGDDIARVRDDPSRVQFLYVGPRQRKIGEVPPGPPIVEERRRRGGEEERRLGVGDFCVVDETRDRPRAWVCGESDGAAEVDVQALERRGGHGDLTRAGGG